MFIWSTSMHPQLLHDGCFPRSFLLYPRQQLSHHISTRVLCSWMSFAAEGLLVGVHRKHCFESPHNLWPNALVSGEWSQLPKPGRRFCRSSFSDIDFGVVLTFLSQSSTSICSTIQSICPAFETRTISSSVLFAT